jgi:CubicO group peptidase (beta-lactamase class C family)
MPTLKDLRDLIDSKRAESGVPGVALGVVREGRSETATFGVTNVEEPAPVLPETLFEIGSITKTFTATALVRLAEQGRIALDVPVQTYLPELRLSDGSAAASVTLRQLLTHRGGLESEWFVDGGFGDDVLRRLTERLGELEMLAAPGTCFSYSNPGFALAGRVLEVATGRSFADALRELLQNPLGLSSLCYRRDDRFSPPWAAGHVLEGRAPVVARPSEIGRMIPAAGGLCSNVGDLLRWAEFHLTRGRNSPDAGLFRPETFEAMQTPAAESFPFRTWIGLPWGIDKRDGVRVLGHGGRTWGYVGTIELVPARDVALVILTNAYDGVELMRDLREMLFRELAGLAPLPPFSAAAIEVPDRVLADYAGQFGSRHAMFTVTPGGNSRLRVEVESRGFPRPESHRRFPPERWAFSAPDQVFQEEPPCRYAERRVFVRDARGVVRFLRGTSLYPRR